MSNMRHRRSHFLGVITLLSVATLCHGQSFTPQSIHFTGADDYSDVELANAAGLKVGQSYTTEDLNRHAQQLLDTGLFEKISYKFDGVKLNYTVKAKPQALPMQVNNLPLETGADLDARLRAKVPLYRGALPAQGAMVENVRHLLEEMLAAEGLHAHVAATLVQDSDAQGPSAVRFSIDSNAVKTGTLKLEGVSDFLKPELERNKTLTDVPFDTEKSAGEIERNILAIYAGHGFAAAQVQVVRYGYPIVDEGVIRVPYKVTVKEGRAYRLGAVKLAQDLPIDPAEVDRLMAARSTFMPESMFVANLISQVEFRLKGQGYLNCRVTLEPQLDEKEGVVNYTIQADLGSSNRAAL